MMDPQDTLKQHQLFRQMLEIEYHDLEHYVSTSLSLLKKNEAESDQQYQHLKNQMPKGLEDSAYQYSSLTPYLLKHALFISAYSLMEYSLKKFCEITTFQMNQYANRVSNFEKVNQFYSYLTNEVQLGKANTGEDWEKLSIFKDIRNSIVHYNSTIGKNISAKSYEFIKQDPRIQFEEPRGFRIKEDALVLELIDVSKSFLFTLIDEYHQKYFLV